jgi:hypothetical protein
MPGTRCRDAGTRDGLMLGRREGMRDAGTLGVAEVEVEGKMVCGRSEVAELGD